MLIVLGNVAVSTEYVLLTLPALTTVLLMLPSPIIAVTACCFALLPLPLDLSWRTVMIPIAPWMYPRRVSNMGKWKTASSFRIRF